MRAGPGAAAARLPGSGGDSCLGESALGLAGRAAAWVFFRGFAARGALRRGADLPCGPRFRDRELFFFIAN